MSRVCDETFLVFGTFVVSPGEAKKRGILGTKVFFASKREGKKLSLNVKLRSYGGMTEMGRNIHTRTGVESEERGWH